VTTKIITVFLDGKE